MHHCLMRDILLYIISGCAFLFILGYCVHIFVGGMVSPGTEYTLIGIVVSLGLAAVAWMVRDAIKQNRRY